MNEIIKKIEDMEFTVREYFFVGIILFLVGLLMGIIISPKGERTIGSNNGNREYYIDESDSMYDEE